MHQEYVQFDEESLEKVVNLVIKTRLSLRDFWDVRNITT